MKEIKLKQWCRNTIYILFFAVIDYVICWRAFELFTQNRLTQSLAIITCIGMIVVSLIGVAWLQEVEGGKHEG
jgi:biotin transporter BioY